ncbi:MAG: DUF1275 domain-containing protein [Clostridiales bacterium]|nr:DUF1275 domain-containing protein [Clostridiales bacterium]
MREKSFFNLESVTAIILSFVGGILDIYCLFNFDFYATMHTGNIIKMVENLIDGNIEDFIFTILFIVFFTVGLFIANSFEKKHNHKGVNGHLIICLVFFVFIFAIPNDNEPGVLSAFKLFSACICGFLGALLIHSFTHFGNYTYSSTAMTSNMNRAVSNVYDRVITKDRKFNYGIAIYGLIFLFFISGVMAGYAFMRLIPFPDTDFWNLYKYNFIILIPIICVSITYFINSKSQRKSEALEQTVQEEPQKEEDA